MQKPWAYKLAATVDGHVKRRTVVEAAWALGGKGRDYARAKEDALMLLQLENDETSEESYKKRAAFAHWVENFDPASGGPLPQQVETQLEPVRRMPHVG